MNEPLDEKQKRQRILRLMLELIVLLIILAAVFYAIFYLFRQKMWPEVIKPTPTVTPAPAVIPQELPQYQPWFSHDVGKISLAFFYKPPNDEDEFYLLAEKYNAVVLTGNDEPARDIIKAAGLQTEILRYVLFNEIYDQGSCIAKPYQNQAAYLAGDLCRLLEDHPEWFLKNEEGEPIQLGPNGRMMDPGEQGWRKFFFNRVSQYNRDYEWDGFFFDNIEVSTSVFSRLSDVQTLYAKDYPDQHQFIENIILFLSEVTAALREQFPDAPIVGNMIDINYNDAQSVTDYYRLLAHLNGVMIEDFAMGWNNRYKTASDWEAQMELVEQTQKLGRNLLLIVQNDLQDANLDMLTFGLASYFLTDYGLSSFRYIVANDYRDPAYYSFYELDLGPAVGERYKDGNVWRREFQKGDVWVNPISHESAIIVNKETTDETTEYPTHID